MWDLWWTEWHWGTFSPSTSVSPTNCHSTDCSTFIIGTGTIGQLVADVPRGLSLTPPQETKKKKTVQTIQPWILKNIYSLLPRKNMFSKLYSFFKYITVLRLNNHDNNVTKYTCSLYTVTKTAKWTHCIILCITGCQISSSAFTLEEPTYRLSSDLQSLLYITSVNSRPR
jgi:hypothetical protein